MVSFFVYDMMLLIAFAVMVFIFLYSKRKNLTKEGLLILYKASWGIKLIERFTKKNKKWIKISGYISVAVGYILMFTMIYFFFKIILIYIFNPDIVRAIKIPPIMPLIPYLPKVFKLDFLPPFYFIYWIIIIAIVAIPHEFAHGIYASLNKVRIKSTGFGFFPFFLPVFLAAFVEQDDKQMQKQSKFNQMVILSGGAFANILTSLFFLVILWIFFSLSFAPVGIEFDAYSYSLIDSTGIVNVNGVLVDNPNTTLIMSLLNPGILNTIGVEGGGTYLLSKELFSQPKNQEFYALENKLVLYDDAPAIRNGLVGAISEINGVGIESKEILSQELSKYSPNENITIKLFDGEVYIEEEITLGEKDGRALLGVAFIDREASGLMSKIIKYATFFKQQGTSYQPKFFFSTFLYNLLWWLILICISVALVNMLPVGIFDGGRFFYLTVLALTRNEKAAKRSFAFVTYFFLFILFVIMWFWAKSVF